MRPHEHLLFAALPIGLYVLARHRRLPTGYTIAAVLLGTQLPDLIDKPLAWSFGVLPSGRMFAHSLVVSLPVLAVGGVLATRRGYVRWTAVFVIAYLSHIIGDFYPIIWQGTDYYFFPNLFWPLLRANPDQSPSFLAHAPPSIWSILLSIGIFLCLCGYAALDIARRRGMVRDGAAVHPLS